MERDLALFIEKEVKILQKRGRQEKEEEEKSNRLLITIETRLVVVKQEK